MSSNGRVNIKGDNTIALFSMKDKIPVHSQSNSYTNAMTGTWDNTMLSSAYFSSANIQAIQNGIRAGVFNNSKGQYLVGEQNSDELKIIMRSIFLQNSKNLPTNITEQITELNNIVLTYSIKQVYREAESYLKYKHDVSNMYEPIARPVMSSIKHRQLEFKTGL